MQSLFDLRGRVAVITGGAGLLGVRHAEAIASAGGIPVLVDISAEAAERTADGLKSDLGADAIGIGADITNATQVEMAFDRVIRRYSRIDILINNAANNPKVENAGDLDASRLENFSLDHWNKDLAVGLTGAFLCAKVFGAEMAKRRAGIIVNVSSDLGLIAPDQRLYRKPGLDDARQPVKPVTYSVIKTGLIGLTRYLATYWCDRGVRVNALCPGGVSNGQPDDFVRHLSNLIPLGRMANVDEYKGAILFLCSDASSYMTGAVLAVDGGRSTW